MDVKAPDLCRTLVSIKTCSLTFWTAFLALTHGPHAVAESEAELANPVAALISAPIEANYDENIGPNEDGSVWRINIQPVIPISIAEDWNLISRTILPIIKQEDIPKRARGIPASVTFCKAYSFLRKNRLLEDLSWV